MDSLNALLQLLLIAAVFMYFGGFVAAPPLRFNLWRWSAGLIAIVFLIALVVVEVRVHPFAAMLIVIGASLTAYAVLEARRRYVERARRPAAPPFLNLRVTGKTVADIDDDHPFAAHTDEEDE